MKGVRRKVLLSMAMTIIIVWVAASLYTSLEQDMIYVSCLNKKSEDICRDKGGVDYVGHSYPHVKCNGYGDDVVSFNDVLGGTNVYIFNETEILDCLEE